MRLKRVTWFFLMIFIGLGLGLLFGWFVFPWNNAGATPETLRADYKADFVLMTAEIYQMDQDLAEAAQRLSRLGDRPADLIAAEGLASARGLAYAVEDLALMERLYRDLHDQVEEQAGAGDQP